MDLEEAGRLMGSGRMAVYSAVFGTRDVPREVPEGAFDFYLFTDQDVQVNRGTVVRLDPPLEDPKRSSGWLKTNFPSQLMDYSSILWIDSSISLKTVEGLADYLAIADMAVFSHPERKCIYSEASICHMLCRDRRDVIEAHVARYKAEGYPENNGLVATGGLLRGNTEAVRFFNELWWGEIQRGSRRDQLSFNYVAWALGMRYAELVQGDVWSNPWWTYIGHAQQKESDP